MKRPILITGGSELIGSFFLKQYFGKTDCKIVSPLHSEMDITNLDSIKRFFDKHLPETLIHFAAFRNATDAEQQRGDRANSVWKVNVEGCRNIAKVGAEYNSYIVHISTDYVFAGSKKKPGPYSEDTEPNDSSRLLSWYGITKREAERILQSKYKNSAIIRICNISMPPNKPEVDYVGKILWLYERKRIYPMFDDQVLTLTYIPTLTDLIIKLLKTKLPGVFHVSTVDLVTPHQLANFLIEQAYGLKNEIKGVSIDSYLKSNPRRYPKHGGLKSLLTQKKMGLKFMTWQDVVKRYIKSIKEAGISCEI